MYDICKSVWEDKVRHDKFGAIKVPTFKEVMKNGEDWYDSLFPPFRLSKELIKVDDERDILVYIVVSSLMELENGNVKDPTFLEQMIEAIGYFYQTNDIGFNEEEFYFSIRESGIEKLNNPIEINRDNFKEFCDFILYNNGMKKAEPLKIDIEDEEIKKRYLIMKQRQREYESNNRLTLSYIGFYLVIATKGAISKEKVLNSTVTEVMKLYRYFVSMERYEINIKQALAGADSKKLDLTHWAFTREE